MLKKSVRFYHLRMLNEPSLDSYSWGSALDEDIEIKSDISPFGGATFAWRLLKQHPLHNGKHHILFSMSKCCPKDHYNKKIGRQITEARLVAKRDTETIIFDTIPTNSDVIEQLIDHYSDDEEMYQGNIREYLAIGRAL